MQGNIQKLTTRGFGFISCPGRAALYFHAKDCIGRFFDALTQGDAVTFDLGENDSGEIAVNVQKLTKGDANAA